MTKMKLLAAAAVVSGLIATPAMAKDQMRHRAQMDQQISANNVDDGYRDGRYANRDTGFWPGDVAEGVVDGAVGIAGAAVGTAGAIATAPFQSNSWNNSYAYDTRGYAPRDSYAQRNGFVCQPGTWFRGEDGRPHICQ